jgi:hypothetical protein
VRSQLDALWTVEGGNKMIGEREDGDKGGRAGVWRRRLRDLKGWDGVCRRR